MQTTHDAGHTEDVRRALTVDEVAALYGVSTSHIRRLIRNGVIAKVPHMGQRVVISVGELDRVFGGRAA